jgi:hypothetical protein
MVEKSQAEPGSLTATGLPAWRSFENVSVCKKYTRDCLERPKLGGRMNGVTSLKKRHLKTTPRMEFMLKASRLMTVCIIPKKPACVFGDRFFQFRGQ